MSKAGMGEKRRCLACSTAFFDLGRTPIVCPKCAEVFHVVEFARSAPGRSGPFQSRARWRAPAAGPAADEIIAENEVAEEVDDAAEVVDEEIADDESAGVELIDEVIDEAG